jgi:glycosyltransferase involved in cell wall biosynthesis
MISIIVPCFNASQTLAAALWSALAQKGVNLEIIVVDDGSSDDSLVVAGTFEPEVQIATGPNRGVSAARNIGILKTTGEWIVFLDADDTLLPGTLGQRLATAAETAADVVICEWQESAEINGARTDGRIRRVDYDAIEADAEIACATHVWATTAAIMYRRSLVEKIGGFRQDLPIIQDARFLFDAAYHGARFAYSPHVGAIYRVSEQGLARNRPDRFWRDVLTNGKQI